MNKRISSIMCLAVMLTMTGCGWSRAKLNVENFLTKNAKVKVGETKADELEKIIGNAPNTIIPFKNKSKIYVYNFGDTKTKSFNLVVINISKSNIRLDSAYYFINSDDVVTKASISRNSEDVPWEWWAFGE